MKKLILVPLFMMLVVSCAPVLSQTSLQQGIYNPNLTELKENKILNDGKLFIFGGIIVNTTATKEGSLIEAIYVPVSGRGYFKDWYREGGGRFMAIYKQKEILDPVIYSPKREITLAGEFVGIRKGKIGELDYEFPFFEIKDIYLWPDYKARDPYYYTYPPPHYYPPYYRGYYRDPYYYPSYYPWRYW
jgi:outer membrane lipoprotein